MVFAGLEKFSDADTDDCCGPIQNLIGCNGMIALQNSQAADQRSACSVYYSLRLADNGNADDLPLRILSIRSNQPSNCRLIVSRSFM